MNISAPFIRRPVATSLLAAAVVLGGASAYYFLPVAPLPQMDFPTIQVSAGLPGASPETMASSVATPLERQFSRIAGITEMTSSSLLGSTSITLQFDLDRNIDGAARDVQAAINAATGQLPAGLPTRPYYRKVNPSESVIQVLVLQSDEMPIGRLYDMADSIVAQKVSQIRGVGQVTVGGTSRPGVRIELNPTILAHYGLSFEDVRTVLSQVNANTPKGSAANGSVLWVVGDDDQLFDANHYAPIIVAYRNGAPVRLRDIATIRDSVEDIHTSGILNRKPSILIQTFRQPGANIVETVDRIRASIPLLQASIPPSAHLFIGTDRVVTIRSSVREIQKTLLLTILLVIISIFIFLRNIWATTIPAVAVPVSLIGTFGVMILFGYSLDNLSLMALTISSGFVVDDAIVVIENITRYRETGLSPMQAALKGSKEIGFTVLTMSTSLIAVFLPILLMGGIVGRLFREFAVTLSAAIIVSLGVSLTATPMMCAKFLKSTAKEGRSWIYRWSERGFKGLAAAYERRLRWVLRHQPLTLAVTVATVCLNIYLFIVVPKGFFPQQDTGLLRGTIQGSQDISFDAMVQKQRQFMDILMKDPANRYCSFHYRWRLAQHREPAFVGLKPLSVRTATARTG